MAPLVRSPAARGRLISLLGIALLVLGAASAVRRAGRVDLQWRAGAFTRTLDEKMEPGLGTLFPAWKLARERVPESGSVVLLGLGQEQGEWAVPRLAALLYPRPVGDIPVVPPPEAQDAFLSRTEELWFLDHCDRPIPATFPPHSFVATEGPARLWKVERR